MSNPTRMPQRDSTVRADAPTRVSDLVERNDPHGLGPEPDEIYGLVSSIYHAMQGSVTYDGYITDAQRAGDEELMRFFRACRNEEHARSRRAKTLLLARLADAAVAIHEPVPVQASASDGASAEDPDLEGDDVS